MPGLHARPTALSVLTDRLSSAVRRALLLRPAPHPVLIPVVRATRVSRDAPRRIGTDGDTFTWPLDNDTVPGVQ